jgi:tetratricopeptide (TPR) repeat protein
MLYNYRMYRMKFKKLLYACIALTVFSTPLTGRDPGLSAYYEGEFDKAHSYYQKQLDKDPQNPKLLYNYGTSALSLNDLDAARSLLRRSLTGDNKQQCADAHYNLGQIALKRQDLPAALEHFKKSLLNDPGDMDSKVMYEQLRAMMNENMQQEQQNEQGDDDQQKEGDTPRNDEKQKSDEDNDKASQQQEQSSDGEEENESSQEQQAAESRLSEEDLHPQELSKEQIKHILNAMREEEMESMKKLILSKSNLKRTKRSKEW